MLRSMLSSYRLMGVAAGPKNWSHRGDLRSFSTSTPSATAAESGSENKEEPKTESSAKPDYKTHPWLKPWYKKKSIWFFITLGVAGTTGLLIDNFFLEDYHKWVLSRFSKRTGLEITYQKVDGSAFTGRITLHGVKIAEPQHEEVPLFQEVEDTPTNLLRVIPKTGGVFLYAHKIEVKVRLWHRLTSLFSKTLRIKNMTVEQIRGHIPDHLPLGLRDFVIGQLRCDDVYLRVGDNGALLDVAVLDAMPVRSEFLAHDLLYSTVEGLFRGPSYGVVNLKITSAPPTPSIFKTYPRRLKWEIKDLPYKVLVPRTDSLSYDSPLNLIDNCTLELDAINTPEVDAMKEEMDPGNKENKKKEQANEKEITAMVTFVNPKFRATSSEKLRALQSAIGPRDEVPQRLVMPPFLIYSSELKDNEGQFQFVHPNLFRILCEHVDKALTKKLEEQDIQKTIIKKTMD